MKKIEKLFINVGKKIMAYAKFNAVCGFVLGGLSLLIGLVMVIDYNDDGWIFMGAGIIYPLLVLITSWFLYAFGQMSEDIHNQSQQADNSPDEDEIPDI